MGYYSNVRVMTNLEGFEKMQEIAWNLAKKNRIDNENVLFPDFEDDPQAIFDYYDAQEDYLCFGFDWVKWYDEYQNVSLFMEVLKIANENDVPWQFMRVGEEYNDVESLCSDYFYDSQVSTTAIMRPQVDIVY